MTQFTRNSKLALRSELSPTVLYMMADSKWVSPFSCSAFFDINWCIQNLLCLTTHFSKYTAVIKQRWRNVVEKVWSWPRPELFFLLYTNPRPCTKLCVQIQNAMSLPKQRRHTLRVFYQGTQRKKVTYNNNLLYINKIQHFSLMIWSSTFVAEVLINY